ncbi:hypothetical protein ACFLTP_09855 [Chloroflexota bacterium]
MGINAPFYPFTDNGIEMATTLDGVYCLYDGSETIFIGKGEGEEGIQGRLKLHQAGFESYCTMRATYYNYEICSDPYHLEIELLTEHKNLFGKLPRCNNIIQSYSNP